MVGRESPGARGGSRLRRSRGHNRLAQALNDRVMEGIALFGSIDRHGRDRIAQRAQDVAETLGPWGRDLRAAHGTPPPSFATSIIMSARAHTTPPCLVTSRP